MHVPLVETNRIRIHTLAMGARLPTIDNSRGVVETGGRMSYGRNQSDLFGAPPTLRTNLRGARPADFPVEHPTNSISSST